MTAFTVWCDLQGRPGGNIYFAALQDGSGAFAEQGPPQQISGTIQESIDPSFNRKEVDKYSSFEVNAADSIAGISILMRKKGELSKRNAEVWTQSLYSKAIFQASDRSRELKSKLGSRETKRWTSYRAGCSRPIHQPYPAR